MGSQLRFLIIDDNDLDRQLVTGLWRLEGNDKGTRHVFAEAASLQSALYALHQQEPFDAVLLDLWIPERDGEHVHLNPEDTFRRIYEAARPVPIVVYSRIEDDTLMRQLIAAGATNYVTKLPGLKAQHVISTLVVAATHARYVTRVSQDKASAVAQAERATRRLISASDAPMPGDEERWEALAQAVQSLADLAKLQLEQDARQNDAINTTRVRQISLEMADQILQKEQNKQALRLRDLDKKTQRKLAFIGLGLTGGGFGLEPLWHHALVPLFEAILHVLFG